MPYFERLPPPPANIPNERRSSAIFLPPAGLPRKHPKSFEILTTTNGEFVDMTDNWLEGIRRLGLRYNITLVCEDDIAYEHSKQRAHTEFKILNTRNYSMSGLLRDGSFYQDLILKRIVYIKDLVSSGRDVLLVDIDAVWLKDPLTHVMDVYDSYDIWIAQGMTIVVPCPCFMYMKANPTVIQLSKDWISRIHYDKTLTKKERGGKNVTDQWALRPLLEQGEANGSLRVKRLAKTYFPTGDLYAAPRWHMNHSHEVAIAPANHQGRHDGKLAFLKMFNLWFMS